VRSLTVLAVLAAAAVVVPLSCARRESPQPTLAASPTIPKLASEGPLTEADLQAYLTVRSKALQKLEDALDEVEKSGGDVLAHVQELTVAERDAARSLGVEWRRFTWVRDQVGRLLTTQRQREDQRVLLAELTRAKQFLEAQLKVLDGQLEKIESEQHLPTPKAEEMKLLEAARAEIAILQGRQDRVQRRVQELLQRAARSGATPVPTSSSDR
jgi:chromosome segregation ATPase